MPLSARTEAWARLALAALPAPAISALLQRFESPERILGASRRDLALATSDATAARLLAPVEHGVLDATRRWLDDDLHHLLAWEDADYPQALFAVGDAPPALFYIGRREILNRPAIAIVGSRHATPQGEENASEFARALAQAGLVVVSGLALGIDGAAHRGALEANGDTLACVGTGLDRVYPASHRDLARRIAEAGGLLSEFPPGTPPLRWNFPRRNRLISALSRGVLVVEATVSSGSLITARLAGEQGRDVFAVPGSIHSPLSRGCHRLIRDGAKLVETANDVLEELGIESLRVTGSGSTFEAPEHVAELHRAVVDALGSDPCDVDTLIGRTRLPAEDIVAALVELEMDGQVASLPGGRWQRLVTV